MRRLSRSQRPRPSRSPAAVDIFRTQIQPARAAVPDGESIWANILDEEFDEESFDAVVGCSC
jgi:hypothetical protein